MNKNLTIEKMNEVYNTPEVKNLVGSWLLQKAYTEMIREKVDSIYEEILQEIPVYEDLIRHSPRYNNEPIKRITHNKYLYLSEDEESINKIYNLADKTLREKGLKPDTMKNDYCPALVAESDLTDIEHKIIEITGNQFGINVNNLLYSGLDSYHKWIDLTVSAIVNMPDFKNPLDELTKK